MKRLTVLMIGAVLMTGFFLAGCKEGVDIKKVEIKKNGYYARISTEKGDIEFDFYPEAAPGHVKNFVTLASEGFYDGLKFHRVVPNFVIQGGCPKGDGTGGPGYTIKAEFNSRKHLDGTVSMARSQHPDSAGSQFYICLGAQSFLDGKYTVFGQVTKGMDVVNSIKIGDVMKKVTILKKNLK